VARLKGRARKNGKMYKYDSADHDCLVVQEGTFSEMVVLRSSCQCAALVQFSGEMVDTTDDESEGNALIYRYHMALQLVLDRFLNHGVRTLVDERLPSERPKNPYSWTATNSQVGDKSGSPTSATLSAFVDSFYVSPHSKTVQKVESVDSIDDPYEPVPLSVILSRDGNVASSITSAMIKT